MLCSQAHKIIKKKTKKKTQHTYKTFPLIPQKNKTINFISNVISLSLKY